MKQPELGQIVARLRKEKGYTQEELVEKCNINVRTIQRIESGEVTPRVSTLRIIFEAMGETYRHESEEENQQLAPLFSKKGFEQLFQLKKTTPGHIFARQLQVAWVLAIASFMMDFVVKSMEFQHAFPWTFKQDSTWYFVVKIITMLFYLYWQRGIFVVGKLYKVPLLKIMSAILIGFSLMNTGYQITHYFIPEVKMGMIDKSISMTIGVTLFIYAFGLFKLPSPLKTAAIVAGISSLLAGFFFGTVIFWWMGMILLLPLDLAEIIILYKAGDQLLEQNNTE